MHDACVVLWSVDWPALQNFDSLSKKGEIYGEKKLNV